MARLFVQQEKNAWWNSAEALSCYQHIFKVRRGQTARDGVSLIEQLDALRRWATRSTKTKRESVGGEEEKQTTV